MDDFSRALAAAAIIDGQHFTLPGCGTLAGTYVPARVDHLARTVQPPSLEVSWSKEPSAAAQTFADLLAASGATNAEASATEAAWVETLHAGDPIEVGDLGTLRLDRKAGTIEFDANDAGLRGAYWSGGPVAVEPLSRRPKAPKTVGVDAVQPAAPRPRRRRARGNSPRVAAIATAAAALLIAIVAYAAFSGDDASPTPRVAAEPDEKRVVPVRGERLNRSPRETPVKEPARSAAEAPTRKGTTAEPRADRPARSTPPASAAERSAAASATPPAASRPVQPRSNDGSAVERESARPTESKRATEAATRKSAADGPAPSKTLDPAALAGEPTDYDPDAVQAVVILGSFGSADNAARLTERVAEDGHVPYVGQRGRLTQVGVTVSASSDNEVAVILEQLREAYNAEAYVIATE